MHQGHLRGIAHILEIVIERAQLADQHHALIHDGFAGQGTDVGIGILLFKHPAQNIEPPVKIRAGGDGSGTIQKALPDTGHGAAGSGSKLGRMAGHVPPAQNRQPFGGSKLLKNAADVLRAHLVLRQEKHAHAVITGIAQTDAFLLGPGRKQGMGQIGHDAHAVAGGAQGVAARPMGQALHDGQRLIHGAVGAFAAQIHDGPHATAFVLQFFVI